jgi:hypothetical protein
MLFPHSAMTNQELFDAVQARLKEIVSTLDELYVLPRTFDLSQKIAALNQAYVDISREAAEALLSSAESIGAAKKLKDIAKQNIEVASHMVILTGYLGKATSLLGAAEKVIKAAKQPVN